MLRVILKPQDVRLLELLEAGRSLQEIAQELAVSHRTIGLHVEVLRQVLEVSSNSDVAGNWRRLHEPGHPERILMSDPWAGKPLTPRELQVANLIATGMTDQEIAAELGINYRVVAKHRTVIMFKLNLTGRSEIVEMFRSQPPGAEP